MSGKAAGYYNIFNAEKEDCHISSIINNTFRGDTFQNEIALPKEIGEGYCRRIIVKPSMDINITDVTLKEEIELGGDMNSHSFGLAFCLGEAYQWRVEEDRREYEIECGECYIFKKMEGNGICQYNSGKHFAGLSIQLSPDLIKGFIEFMGGKYPNRALSYGSSSFFKAKYSPAVRLILNDIINCKYKEDIKRIYLEGKVLELLAVYLNELINEKSNVNSSIKLSRSDMAALQKAKDILDASIVAPPTIGKLARLICLNEYKLKVGFKELYHMPIHAYIIDKRLQMARVLLEEKKLRVTEAVVQVGYSDASHFAEKFRKKYGINPSELVKASRRE